MRAPEIKIARIGVWGRILLALAAIDVVLLAARALATLATVLTDALVLIAIFLLARYLIRQSRALWRLRNRLIVTYLFIAVVPIALILALVGLSVYIVTGQVASYLVTSEITRRAGWLAGPARILSQTDPAQRGPIVQEMIPFLRDRMPGLQVLVTGAQTLHSPPESALEPPPPGWKEYTGLVRKGGEFFFMSLARSGDCQVLILAPLTGGVLRTLVPGIGEVILSEQIRGIAGLAGRAPRAPRVTAASGSVPPAFGGLDYIDFTAAWINQINVADWSRPGITAKAGVEVTTRPSAVLDAVFADSAELAQTAAAGLFVGIAITLLMVELIALFIGVALARSITVAINSLYEGTLKVGRGELSWRIPVKGRDQLAALGESFNDMSSQLENLVTVARENERMQSELTIASEVQNQLFPHSPPPLRTIRMAGVCQPARMVSGDYYDYLCLPNGTLAMAIGDVAGKGISAALLMASIQSIMRTQLAAGVPLAVAAGSGQQYPQLSTAGVVGQLNRQLYANTSPEKYATFFFSLYDENTRSLTYTNAGHLPPLRVCGDRVEMLEVTGTVVGAFPAVTYQERTIGLSPDDVLIAYTDGITEPENAYGEEFGAERLADTVRRNLNREPNEIAAKVLEAVRQWTSAPELPDDMTVVVLRGVA